MRIKDIFLIATVMVCAGPVHAGLLPWELNSALLPNGIPHIGTSATIYQPISTTTVLNRIEQMPFGKGALFYNGKFVFDDQVSKIYLQQLGWGVNDSAKRFTIYAGYSGYKKEETQVSEIATVRSVLQSQSLCGTVSISSPLWSILEFHRGLSLSQNFLSSATLEDSPLNRTALYQENHPFDPRISLNASLGIGTKQIKLQRDSYRLITALSGGFSFYHPQIFVNTDLVNFYKEQNYEVLSFKRIEQKGFSLSAHASIIGPTEESRAIPFSQGFRGSKPAFFALSTLECGVFYGYSSQIPKFITYRFYDGIIDTASGQRIYSRCNLTAQSQAELLYRWVYADMLVHFAMDLDSQFFGIFYYPSVGVRGKIGSVLVNVEGIWNNFEYPDEIKCSVSMLF